MTDNSSNEGPYRSPGFKLWLEYWTEIVENRYWIAAQNNPNTLDNYISMPTNLSGLNMLIAKKRLLFGYGWKYTHKILNKGKYFMPTLRLFVDFVNYLGSDDVRDGNGKKLSSSEKQDLLEEIIKPGEWKGEWLDARFRKIKGEVFMNYEHVFINEKLHKYRSKRLFSLYLRDQPYFTDVFGSNQEHGLPTSLGGEIYYLSPSVSVQNLTIATFESHSEKVVLNCINPHHFKFETIGVRPVRFIRY